MILYDYIDYFLQYKLILFFILGSCFGSLLNVIIIRMPIILSQEQLRDKFNLFYPRSKCFNCNTQLKFWQNIPLISYLLLRGKCFYCHYRFSKNYFIIELITALSFMLIAYFNGNMSIICAKCCFVFFILAIIIIDFKHLIIPDELSITMLWFGLVINISNIFVTNVKYSILGAVFGYLFFYFLAFIYQLITKKEGLGGGDFKLFAALLAWVGIDMFIPILLISSSLAIIYFLMIKIIKKITIDEQIPFGPFLGIAGLIILFNLQYIKFLFYY